jgi:hypothetical protein
MNTQFEAFRIYCGFLAAEFSLFSSDIEDAAMSSPFFRKRSRSLSSYNTIEETYGFTYFLMEEFGDAGVAVVSDLRKILHNLNLFYDDVDCPFRASGMRMYTAEDMTSEINSWLASAKNNVVDAFWREIDAGCNDGIQRSQKEENFRKYALMKRFQEYIVSLNSLVHCWFRGSPDYHRVLPRVHFLLSLDQDELFDFYCDVRYNRSIYVDGGFVNLKIRERSMFLRAVFIEHDYVVIPFFDTCDFSTVRLVVVSFSDKVITLLHLISNVVSLALVNALYQKFYLYDPLNASEDFERSPHPSPLQSICILFEALNKCCMGTFFDITEWQSVVFKGPTFANTLSGDDTMFACLLLTYLLATGRDLHTFHGDDMNPIKERFVWLQTSLPVKAM